MQVHKQAINLQASKQRFLLLELILDLLVGVVKNSLLNYNNDRSYNGSFGLPYIKSTNFFRIKNE